MVTACDQRSPGLGLFDTSSLVFFTRSESQGSPKTLSPQINFLPERLASAEDFFMGDLSQPFPCGFFFFPPLHCASLSPCFTLRSPLPSIISPVAHNGFTLHTATVFWFLLPCDFFPLSPDSGV